MKATRIASGAMDIAIHISSEKNLSPRRNLHANLTMMSVRHIPENIHNVHSVNRSIKSMYCGLNVVMGAVGDIFVSLKRRPERVFAAAVVAVTEWRARRPKEGRPKEIDSDYRRVGYGVT
jgi:hypothetical protein